MAWVWGGLRRAASSLPPWPGGSASFRPFVGRLLQWMVDGRRDRGKKQN